MAAPELKYIPLDQIRVNPVSLRDANRKSAEFTELMGSIAKEGVMTPVIVQRKPESTDNKLYQLVDGLQRYTAACEVGTGAVERKDGTSIGQYLDVTGSQGNITKVGVIPAQIIERSDADSMVSQIVANAQRIETKPIEYARALIRYLGYNPTLTESGLAAMLNKSPQWVNKMLQLNKLVDAIKPLVNENKIVVANAAALAKLPPEEQPAWVERAQTMEAVQFGAAAATRLREIREANRQGKEPAEEKYTPIAHIRKKSELESAAVSPDMANVILQDVDFFKNYQANPAGVRQASIDAFQFGLKWALNLDPHTVSANEEKFNKRKAEQKAEKAKRDAEKASKREQEASDLARKARDAVAAVPV